LVGSLIIPFGHMVWLVKHMIGKGAEDISFPAGQA